MHGWVIAIAASLTAIPQGVLAVTAPPAAGPVGGFEGLGAGLVHAVVADTVPGFMELRPSGLSVMEAAWGSDGSPDVLQLVVVGVETEVTRDLTVRVEAMAKWGRDEVPLGSLQGLSSLDAEDFAGLGETWVEWTGLEGLRLKAGRVDGNTEFAAAEAAGPFANPSFGLSPALALLPSYPAPAPSLNVFVRLAPRGVQLGSGVYRSMDGIWSVVGQLEGSIPGVPVRWAAGGAVPLGSGPAGGEREAAWYLIVEGVRRGSTTVFGKVAGAGELLHVAGGITAPVPGTEETRVGLAGSLVSAGGVGNDELVAEVFLAIRPVPWLVVQPDVQLRVAPGASPRVGALLRVAVER